jgi:hypothetical protein
MMVESGPETLQFVKGMCDWEAHNHEFVPKLRYGLKLCLRSVAVLLAHVLMIVGHEFRSFDKF